MEYKDQFMLELDVFSEGMHSMDMMHLPRRSLQAKPVIVGQDGAAFVLALERKRIRAPRNRKKR
jgi:hypothetical protein